MYNVQGSYSSGLRWALEIPRCHGNLSGHPYNLTACLRSLTFPVYLVYEGPVLATGSPVFFVSLMIDSRHRDGGEVCGWTAACM